MAFGFDTTLGYISPTFDEVLAALQTIYESETGILIDLEFESPSLDLLRTMARQLKAIYDDGAGTYASGFVLTSTGAALVNLLTPFIGPPLAASSSTVILPLTGTLATVVAAGSTVTLDSDGDGATSWTLQSEVIIPADGTFAYASTGPKSAAAASTWSIATPILGWDTAGPNVAAADQGRAAETPLEYRSRFSLSVQGTRILAAVLAVPGVTAATIFENPTDIPDSYWGATHWVEILVQGGTDAAVAAAIEGARVFTVQTLGTVTVSVTAAGYAGGQVDIRFSRPNEVEVWVTLTITKGEAYSGDTSAVAIAARETALDTKIVTWASSRPVGLDVSVFQVATQAAQTASVPGIADITGVIGIVDPPLGSSIVAAPRDLLVFDAARIVYIGV